MHPHPPSNPPRCVGRKNKDDESERRVFIPICFFGLGARKKNITLECERERSWVGVVSGLLVSKGEGGSYMGAALTLSAFRLRRRLFYGCSTLFLEVHLTGGAGCRAS